MILFILNRQSVRQTDVMLQEITNLNSESVVNIKTMACV